MDNKDENQECTNEGAEVEKALSLKKSNNAEQHFVLTNKPAKSMKLGLSGNANKKQHQPSFFSSMSHKILSVSYSGH